MIFWKRLNWVCETYWQRSIALFLAVSICAGFYSYGYIVYGYELLDKYAPVWNLFESIKAAGLLVASLLVFSALRPAVGQERDPGWKELPIGWLPISGFVLVASALVLVFWPDIMSEQQEEGYFLSVLSEVFLLAAFVLLALSAWSARQSDRPSFIGLRPVWLLLAMMLVVFLILMEEMSWGQHWLGLTTPHLFEGNGQNEINIHNYFTHPFEAAYYSVAVLVFVVLPFAWPREVPGFTAGLTVFIPPPAFAMLALPLCGIFFETWNYVMNQVLFYLGLLIAVHLFRREENRTAKRNIIVMALLLVLSQIVFLDHGHTLPQGWELTEIREIAIPLAIIAYGTVLFSRFRRDVIHSAEFARPD